MSCPSIAAFVHKRVHFVGIGGSSMSGLCRLVKNMGMQVTGSDRTASHSTEALEAEGIPVTIGHSAQAVHGADLLVYSAAIPKNAPELVEAERLGIPKMERSVLLGQLQGQYPQSVAVTGVHGKTSTTSMLAAILLCANTDPTIHIGGELDLIGSNVRAGKGDVFLTEACEFAESFLQLHTTVSVLLNIDADHLDWYRDIEHIQETFLRFLQGLPKGGTVVGCADDERVAQLLQACPELGLVPVSYALEHPADYTAKLLSLNATGCPTFTLYEKGQPLTNATLQVAGLHMMSNATAACAAARALGISPEHIAQGLGQYKGAHRRFEHTATVQGVALYHDYGHHPTEVRSVIPVAQLQPHQKLWVVFQPHTYSRTKLLFQEFSTAFAGADEVLVTDIYGAREVDPGDIHATQVVDSIRANGVTCTYTPTFEDARDYLFTHWQPGDLVLTLGCGNINLLNELIEQSDKEQRQAP